MNNLILFILKNKILAEILSELNLFKSSKIIHCLNFQDIKEKLKNERLNSNLLICTTDFTTLNNENLNELNLPIIFLIQKNSKINLNLYKNLSTDKISYPFKVFDLISKINICLSKDKFSKNSFVDILEYMLDMNKKEIVKNGLKLKLTEKEIIFLLYLKNNNRPITIENLLKNVWNYSFKTETHTVETHVHRLRKKFLKIFGDKNIIKNSKNGYYI